MIGKEPRYKILAARVTDQEWQAVRDSGQSTDALLYKIIFKRGKS